MPSSAGALLLGSRYAHAACFIVGLFCMGLLANLVGYRVGATVFGPLCEMHAAVTSPRGGKTKEPHGGVGGSLARFLPPLMAGYIASCLGQALLYPGMDAPNGTAYDGQYGMWKELTTGLMWVAALAPLRSGLAWLLACNLTRTIISELYCSARLHVQCSFAGTQHARCFWPTTLPRSLITVPTPASNGARGDAIWWPVQF